MCYSEILESVPKAWNRMGFEAWGLNRIPYLGLVMGGESMKTGCLTYSISWAGMVGQGSGLFAFFFLGAWLVR